MEHKHSGLIYLVFKALGVSKRIPKREINDLRQEIHVKLWLAEKKYDPAKGAESTFYYTVIFNHVRQFIAKWQTWKRSKIIVESDWKNPIDLEQIGGGEEIEETIDLPVFHGRDKVIFDMLQEGKNGAEIGRALGFSKQRGGQIKRRIVKRVVELNS